MSKVINYKVKNAKKNIYLTYNSTLVKYLSQTKSYTKVALVHIQNCGLNSMP